MQKLLADGSEQPSFELPSKRACASKARMNIKKQCKLKAPRGIHVSRHPGCRNADPAPNPPPIESALNPPSTEQTLNKLVKGQPAKFQQGMQTLHAYIDHNTSFAVKKAIVLQVFSTCVRNGMGILQACSLAGEVLDFSPQVVRKWAQDVYVDFFASSEDTTEEQLEKKLESARGKHSKYGHSKQ